MDKYQNKEEARLAVLDALEKYKTAAVAYGMDDSEMRSELDDQLFEADLPFTLVYS